MNVVKIPILLRGLEFYVDAVYMIILKAFLQLHKWLSTKTDAKRDRITTR